MLDRYAYERKITPWLLEGNLEIDLEIELLSGRQMGSESEMACNVDASLFVLFHACVQYLHEPYERCIQPGTRPNNGISIEFDIRPKFAMLWFKMYSTDHNEILHTSQQYNCLVVCRIYLWSAKHTLE